MEEDNTGHLGHGSGEECSSLWQVVWGISEAESTQVNQKPLPFAPPHPKQQPAHRCDSVPCHWRYQPRALIHLLVHFQTEMLNHRISGRGAKTVELSTEDVQGCRSLQGVSLQDEGGILSCKTKLLPCKMGHGVHRSCRYFPPLGTQQQEREPHEAPETSGICGK